MTHPKLSRGQRFCRLQLACDGQSLPPRYEPDSCKRCLASHAKRAKAPQLRGAACLEARDADGR